MEKRVLVFIVAGLSLVLVSCRNPGMYVQVFSGNYAYTRGDYQDANLMYLNAAASGRFTDYISYNLGNVYYALGETSSALEKWNESVKSSSREVEFASCYNRGVLLFEMSRYEEAYASFKKALKIDASDISTKIDLEYCLLKMSVRNSSTAKTGPVRISAKNNKKKDDAMRVLDFVKRFEENSLVPHKGGEHTSGGKENDW